jgi:ethanolamine utilization protein EutN
VRLARVIGTVVATRRSAGLEGIKLLVVQPLDEDRRPAGRPEVAADATAQAGPGQVVFMVASREVAADATAQAGPGQLVFMVASREGAQALPELFVPVDLAITGLVDDVHVVEAARRGGPTASWHRGE